MNIFYTEVDGNLQKELNARGKAGFSDRSTDAINFMTGKIANVEIIAYSKNEALPKNAVGRLGGLEMQTGRYMPSGPNGYLSDVNLEKGEVDYYTDATAAEQRQLKPDDKDIVVGNAYLKKTKFIDSTKRIGPYITDININIGDHSMGLLNKASINIVIPNPMRDLDIIEQTWFRPGRYISIDIEHPQSAVITKQTLLPQTLPNRDKLKELYPNWPIDDFEKKISKMNAVRFEGLITSFDFQYSVDGTVTATLSVTGTSNVYTDISMYIDTDKTKEQTETQAASPDDVKSPGRPEFYDILYNRVKTIMKEKIGETLTNNWILPFTVKDGKNPSNTDRYILVGEPYPPYTVNPSTTGPQPQTKQNIYITLGALIHYINEYVLTKAEGSVKNPEITHTDAACFSNYYENLVSCDPDSVLLLPPASNIPADPISAGLVQLPKQDCNVYGQLIYFNTYDQSVTKWPGVYDKSTTYGRIYPSRIFLNLESIQSVVNSLSEKQTKDFSIATFITNISGMISTATCNSIQLKLVTHPSDQTRLMLMDSNYILEKSGESVKKLPYSVPMFSNHPNGSIVQQFSISAKLPENAKNLAYVMNSGDQVSNAKIAPYMNFMYSAQNVDQINALIQQHATDYEKSLDELTKAKFQYGQSPGVLELRTALYKALAEYLKKPHKDFRTSQQMAAPIFPFEASITIDGINGFRYGDILQFDALPNRYKMNTVFSIINITHAVSNTGTWTTELKCIMRPSID
jgi:hypothetical protein